MRQPCICLGPVVVIDALYNKQVGKVTYSQANGRFDPIAGNTPDPGCTRLVILLTRHLRHVLPLHLARARGHVADLGLKLLTKSQTHADLNRKPTVRKEFAANGKRKLPVWTKLLKSIGLHGFGSLGPIRRERPPPHALPEEIC